MTIRLAPLRPEDVGEALTVQRSAYVSEAQRYHQPLIPPLVETLDQFRADLRIAIGAWSGTRLVGSVRGRVDGPRMEVARFSVAIDFQGKGVGRALLTAVEAAAPPEITPLLAGHRGRQPRQPTPLPRRGLPPRRRTRRRHRHPVADHGEAALSNRASSVGRVSGTPNSTAASV
ncbi:GNAT family N-acetyltransferase [Actinokineospora cianjurensis]|uniref:GNAT family N-acetyltransferase n=1 Tax=Actinokineospora cianjurensis TaxID=585224 RepID=UPI001B85E03D|nr:GNAT family N-acetyltransferase [Actinokineospora cianjurensis]